MTKINFIGKCKIFNNKYVIKEEKDLSKIFDYLTSRDFNDYIKPILRENNYNKYEYIIDNSLSNEQKLEDIAIVLASLHNKTSYHKEVNLDKYEEIYDNLLGYINYLEEYYQNMVNDMEYNEYNSPSENLFLNNYSKLVEVFKFLKDELKKWINLVSNKRTVRVVLNHGNLNENHIINKKLISWNKAEFDTPIVDLINFYHNEWENTDLSNFFKIYFEKFKLNDDEKKLFFINISIPLKIEFSKDELNNVEDVRKLYDYLFKVESLIRPYYSKKDKE